jgi:tetratricopeptide (TPR) repeat protein
MKMLILQFLILGLATAAFADDLQNFSITTNQAAVTEQKLKDYENGRLNLEDFGENVTNAEWQQLIGYYLLHTNDISTKAKLPVARCYAQFQMIPQAMKLGEEYANVYSNDWRAWRLLGYCYEVMNYTNEAIRAYSNAARLGHKLSYEQLAGFAIKSGQLNVVGDIVPQLLALKEAKEIPEEDKFSLITILLAYSMKTDQKEIFIKTLEGTDMGKILRDGRIRQDVTLGCRIFEGKDIDKIRQEMESVTSSTNSVSSPPR